MIHSVCIAPDLSFNIRLQSMRSRGYSYLAFEIQSIVGKNERVSKVNYYISGIFKFHDATGVCARRELARGANYRSI